MSSDGAGPPPLTRRAAQPNRRRPRRALRWAVFAGVALSLLVGRVLSDSRAALRQGAAAEQAGDRPHATRHYLHAARMYVPGSPYVSQALDRLEALAAAAARAGDPAAERAALEAVRAALLGARSLYTPHAERLRAADRRLARLYAAIEDPEVAPGASAAAREAWHLERLSARPGPAAGATAAALFGLALWLGAAVLFIRRGLDRALRLQRSWALASGIGFFVGFALFLLGLRLA
jgi:hypothetical protein